MGVVDGGEIPYLPEALAKRFLNGQRLPLGKEPAVALPSAYVGRVRVYQAERLLGTGQLQEYAILAPERLIAAA